MNDEIKCIKDDLEELLFVTSFFNKDSEVKKNRKKLKECLKYLKKEKYSKIFKDYDEEEDEYD